MKSSKLLIYFSLVLTISAELCSETSSHCTEDKCSNPAWKMLCPRTCDTCLWIPKTTREPTEQTYTTSKDNQFPTIFKADNGIKKFTIMWTGISIGIILFLGTFGICLVYIRKKKKETRKSSNALLEDTATPEAIPLQTIQAKSVDRWEFPRDKLMLSNTTLGSGAFGVVIRGIAKGIKSSSPNDETIVAIKTVKSNNYATEDAIKDLKAEIDLMKLVSKHPNVIELLGCCTQSSPVAMIVEYCANGDLQGFLRNSRGACEEYYRKTYGSAAINLTSKQLLMFACQIGRGMDHLSSMKITHRDLAARNILVDNLLVCKVSDFGFARDVYLDNAYIKESKSGRFPIKWMAIESLQDGICTTKSDVWSYGVVLWEIVTLGSIPYQGMDGMEVVRYIKNGNRMGKPKHCSPELYQLMTNCWKADPTNRPSFNELTLPIRKMIDKPRNKEQIRTDYFEKNSYLVLCSDSDDSDDSDFENALKYNKLGKKNNAQDDYLTPIESKKVDGYQCLVGDKAIDDYQIHSQSYKCPVQQPVDGYQSLVGNKSDDNYLISESSKSPVNKRAVDGYQSLVGDKPDDDYQIPLTDSQNPAINKAVDGYQSLADDKHVDDYLIFSKSYKSPATKHIYGYQDLVGDKPEDYQIPSKSYKSPFKNKLFDDLKILDGDNNVHVYQSPSRVGNTNDGSYESLAE